MNKSVLKFIQQNKKKILGNNSYKRKLFINGKGDLDFFDNKRLLRRKFEDLSKKRKFIIIKRFHKTGLRIDIIDNKFTLYSLDFLNGVETNPFLYNLYKGRKHNKVNYIDVKFSLPIFFKILINIFKYLMWRLVTILKQEPLIIEFFGVDGSGKTFLSNRFYSRCKKNFDIKQLHLWNFKTKKNNKKYQLPYVKQKYNIIISYLKEFLIVFRILMLFFKINAINYKRSVYLFERSCWDIYIDPERYRLCHKPKLVYFLLNFYLKKSYKFYVNKKFNVINSRKKEISYEKYLSLKKSFNVFFKNKDNYNYNRIINLNY